MPNFVRGAGFVLNFVRLTFLKCQTTIIRRDIISRAFDFLINARDVICAASFALILQYLQKNGYPYNVNIPCSVDRIELQMVTRMTVDLKKRDLKLRYYPDEVLRKTAEPVIIFSLDLCYFVEDMIVLMRKFNGIGLAAPQVGMLQRIVIADVGDKPLCIVNPEIISRSGSDSMTEGCLSLPNITVDITRNAILEVKGKNVHGKYLNLEVSGLTARIVQHEIDHLDGVLISDYSDNKHQPADLA